MRNIFQISFTLLFLIIFSLPAANPLFAQSLTPSQDSSDTSNCVVTKVGNPSASPFLPPGCIITPVTNNDLLQAGIDLANAWQKCNNGYSYTRNSQGLENTTVKACVEGQLKDKYPRYINQFDFRFYDFEWPKSNSSVSCIQCTGFVWESLILVYGGFSNAIFGNANTIPDLNSFTVGDGSITYSKIPNGSTPQAGDIGVTKSGPLGHILLVHDAKSAIRFSAIESNYWTPCKVTIDGGDHNVQAEGYVFFRKK